MKIVNKILILCAIVIVAILGCILYNICSVRLQADIEHDDLDTPIEDSNGWVGDSLYSDVDTLLCPY